MIRALRLCFVFVLLAVPAFAQTAATRATLYTEIDTLFADSGADPITPAQLRQSLKNITASSYNDLTDGAVSSTYLPLAGGTLSGNLGTGDGFTISSAGSIALTAGGTNESITLTPSGTGALQVNAYSSPDTGSRFTVGESGAGVVSSLVSYGGSVSLRGFAAGGTIGSPTYTAINQILGRITGSGWFNGSFSPSTKSSVSLLAASTWTDTSTPTLVQFTVTPVGTTTAITPVSIRSMGALQVGESNVSTAAWGVNGVVFSAKSPTITDSSSSGMVAAAVASNFAAPTFAASSATTFTDAANLYIAGDVAAGTNVTLTNSYGLWNAGKTRLDGAVTLGSTINKLTLTAPAAGSTLTIADGATLTASATATVSGTNTGDQTTITGNAGTATALATARTIGNVSFDGTANIVPETSAVVDSTDASSYPLMVDSATGSLQPKTDAGLTYNATTGVLTATGFAGPLTGNVTGDVSGSSGSTTGNAATATTLATPRAIYGNNFDGSAALTQIIASTYGGTGNGFAKFSGPTTSEKTFTLPDANATLLYAGGDAGTPSALVGTNISGTAASLTAGAATALATTRTIGGSNFDGSANVTSFPSPGAIGGSTPSTIAATAIGIGTAPSTDSKINITSNTTSATPTGVWNQSAIQSTATTYYYGFISYPTVADAAFTLPILTHFSAYPNTYGAGATVSVQTGFEATEGLVGGVLNYGFRGRIDDQSGAYNLYMDGTAKNYLAGVLETGSTIELGHASDTTVARGAAGQVTVEGNNVFTAAKSTASELDAPFFAADAGASDTYAATLSPAIGSYVTGNHYRFKANTANTGAATINFNSLGAKTIVKAAGGITTALADNDIRAGQWVDLVYDGTNMQMQSTLGNAASGSGNGYSIPMASTAGNLASGGTTYYGGLPGLGWSTSAATRRVYIPKTGTIVKVVCDMYASGTAGSNESWSVVLRLNNTTDISIASVATTGPNRLFANYALSQAVTEGDYLEIKITTPTWATAPTLQVANCNVYIE